MKFIGGYYKENLDMDQKGLAFKEVLVLSLEDALEHPAMEESNVRDFFYEHSEECEEFYCGERWNNLPKKVKIGWVEAYVQDDEIFGGRFYEESEVEALVAELKENAKNYED